MAHHAAKTNTFALTSTKAALTGTALGAGVAIFTLTASAIPDSGWDRLAQYKSGGNWYIDTGNGYYDGLQLPVGTWNIFGSNEFTSATDQVSREEQIYIAEKVLTQQGWGAWPACSAGLGLSSGPTDRPHPSQGVTPVCTQAAPTAAASSSKTDLIRQFTDRLSNVDSPSDA